MLRPYPALLAFALLTSACASSSEEQVGGSSADLVAQSAHATLTNGHLVIDTSMPAECSGGACADADRDGLSDTWEDAVLERVRPRLVLDPEEPVLTHPHGAFGFVGRVFRPDGAPRNIVRLVLVVGFSFDDGVDILGWSVSGHDGDSERVALELELGQGGRRATVRQAYFSAHENMPNDHSRLYAEDEIGGALRFGRDTDGQPRWLVFPSRAKHAEFADPETCAGTSLFGTSLFAESCGKSETEGKVVFPPIVNAGEREAPRVTDLAVVNFPGESAWDGSSFCGGLPAIGQSFHTFCGGAIAKKLSADPFDDR